MSELLLKLFVKDYKNTTSNLVRKKYGLLASFFGLFTNVILFTIKIVIGVILGLTSLIADSINNLSDFLNNFISIVGLKISGKKPDKEHPYGHQRAEYILSLIIGNIIVVLACLMLYQSVKGGITFFKNLSEGKDIHTESTSYVMYIVSLSLLLFSILTKFVQSSVYASLGKRIDSMPLKALSKDSRNDVIATIFVIISFVIAWFTKIDVDCFFTFIVGIFVLISGIGIIKEASSSLLGDTPDKEMIDKLIKLIQQHEDALGMHDLSIHSYGKEVFAVIHIEVDDSVDINISHQMVEDIEEEAYEQLHINLTVHMDPIKVKDPITDELKNIIMTALNAYELNDVTIHDFHVYLKDNSYDILFDAVIPNDNENEVDETKLNEYLIEEIRKKFKDNFTLHIHFDNQVQDLLLGTSAEK